MEGWVGLGDPVIQLSMTVNIHVFEHLDNMWLVKKTDTGVPAYWQTNYQAIIIEMDVHLKLTSSSDNHYKWTSQK